MTLLLTACGTDQACLWEEGGSRVVLCRPGWLAWEVPKAQPLALASIMWRLQQPLQSISKMISTSSAIYPVEVWSSIIQGSTISSMKSKTLSSMRREVLSPTVYQWERESISTILSSIQGVDVVPVWCSHGGVVANTGGMIIRIDFGNTRRVQHI